jgi:hypothetical protein
MRLDPTNALALAISLVYVPFTYPQKDDGQSEGTGQNFKEQIHVRLHRRPHLLDLGVRETAAFIMDRYGHYRIGSGAEDWRDAELSDRAHRGAIGDATLRRLIEGSW